MRHTYGQQLSTAVAALLHHHARRNCTPPKVVRRCTLIATTTCDFQKNIRAVHEVPRLLVWPVRRCRTRRSPGCTITTELCAAYAAQAPSSDHPATLEPYLRAGCRRRGAPSRSCWTADGAHACMQQGRPASQNISIDK